MATLATWPGMDMATSRRGAAPDSETDLAARYEAVLGNGDAPIWEPTELGDLLASTLIVLVTRTAPAGPLGVKAYAACEDDGALDRIMADLRKSVLREVRKAISA